MYEIVKKGIRGKLCCFSLKHARANSPYIPEDYDPSEPTSYILYFDMNNFTGSPCPNCCPDVNFEYCRKMKRLP